MANPRVFNKRLKLADALVQLKNYDPGFAQQVADDVAALIRYALLSTDQLVIGDMRVERRLLQDGSHKPAVKFSSNMHELMRQDGTGVPPPPNKAHLRSRRVR